MISSHRVTETPQLSIKSGRHPLTLAKIPISKIGRKNPSAFFPPGFSKNKQLFDSRIGGGLGGWGGVLCDLLRVFSPLFPSLSLPPPKNQIRSPTDRLCIVTHTGKSLQLGRGSVQIAKCEIFGKRISGIPPLPILSPDKRDNPFPKKKAKNERENEPRTV
jgi:hypothetical protein